MRYHASSRNGGYGSYPQGEQKGQPSRPHTRIGELLEELLQLLTAAFGTQEPSWFALGWSAYWGAADYGARALSSPEPQLFDQPDHKRAQNIALQPRLWPRSKPLSTSARPWYISVLA
jgi:hypothetical protein